MTTVFFISLFGAMVLAPFVPAWWEWRHPSDAKPLPVPHDDGSDPTYFARRAASGASIDGLKRIDTDMCCDEGTTHQAVMAAGEIVVRQGARVTQWAHAHCVRLDEGSVAIRRVSASSRIEIAPNSCFERLHAPVIYLGLPPSSEEPDGAPEAHACVERRWSELAGARPRSQTTYSFARDCEVPPYSALEGSAVVEGVLHVGAGSVVRGSLKARGGILLDAGCTVEGSVICEHDVHVYSGAQVMGPLVAEHAIFIDRAVRIGRPGCLTSCISPIVVAEAGAVVHGTVWAHGLGTVWSAG